MAALIPRGDFVFDAFQGNAYATINGDLTAYGLVAAKTNWDADYPAASTAKAAAQVAISEKDASRGGHEAALRLFLAKILANPAIKDEAKAAGAMGCELRVFVGATPPADPQDYHFAALDTKTPQLWESEPSDAGQMAHGVARWVNTRGEHGPWYTVSATVPG